MNFLEKNRSLVFWSLQLLGWGFLNIISFFFLKKLSFEFVLFNAVVGMFTGILSTTLIRLYLRKHLTFDDFTLKTFSKVVLACLVGSIIYGGLSFVFGYLYAKLGPPLNDVELSLFKAFDSVWVLILNSIFIIVAWTVCYLVIKLFLRLNKNRIERLELNTTLKQAQLNTLKGQINPHFMFNSLNNIRGLMLEDVEKSREMLTKLSEMLRYSLTKNSSNGIALEEELEMVDNYIALSKIQFENRLNFQKEIDQKTLTIQIPPMIIQLLVENAAKHGIANLKDGGEIKLITKKENQRLIIIVKNSGQLKISKNSTQLGLKNIKERLLLLYGEKANFNLFEEDNQVVAIINIPVA